MDVASKTIIKIMAELDKINGNDPKTADYQKKLFADYKAGLSLKDVLSRLENEKK